MNNTENKVVNNALNESSLAMQFTLFHLAHSPIFPVLAKMREFNSFGQYIAEAADSSIEDFIPDLTIK